jgi:Galactose oxidase-like, Early set domain
MKKKRHFRTRQARHRHQSKHRPPDQNHDHVHPEDHEQEIPEHGHVFIPPPKPGDPGHDVLTKITGKVPAVYLTKSKTLVQLENGQNPALNGSLGYVGRFIKLTIGNGKKFPVGTLVVSLDPKLFGSVAIESLRLFYWSLEDKKYQLIVQSGLGQTRDYIWAKVSNPGLYAVIGVNADPLVARTLSLMKYFHNWLHSIDPSSKRKLHKLICNLILCNPEMQKIAQDQETVRRLVEDNLRAGLPGKWPGGVPPKKTTKDWERLAEICQSADFSQQPPEAELIELQLQAPADAGQWEVLPLGAEGSQILAVHAALLRTNKVAYFGGTEHDPNQTNFDHTRLWDPVTNTIQTLASPNHDLFCCGHAFLGNGKLLAAGGTQEYQGVQDPIYTQHYRGLRNATLLNPKFQGSNPWEPTTPMRPERGLTTGGGRWYPTLLTLQNGRVFTMAGHPEKTDTRHNNIMIEVFKNGTWLDMGDKADAFHAYPRLHLLPNGKVFSSSPMSGQCQLWDPGPNSWSNVDVSPGSEYESFVASSVLLPLLPEENYRARVMVVGGVQPKIIDFGAVTPMWQNTSARTLAGSPLRRHLNAVLLPDGTVLVVGGSETNLDADAVLEAELYNPFSNQWSTLATAGVVRVYHSVALLLPDGRVWTGGSNFNSASGVANRELRIEIFSPPYLFQGPRPTISNVPNVINVSKTPTFTITTPDAAQIAGVNIIRCGSVTHAYDADQRFVKLAIQNKSGNTVTVASPPNGKVAPRGYYLIFILNGSGIPSVGQFIKIKSK